MTIRLINKYLTIVSCWSKVDILPSSENIEDYLILPSDDDTDSIQEMIGCFNFDDPLSANDYIEIDLRLQNQDKLADQEIIELVKGKEAIEEEEDNQFQVSEDKITMDQAMESIERLQFFLMQEERGMGISESFLRELNKFKRELKKEIFVHPSSSSSSLLQDERYLRVFNSIKTSENNLAHVVDIGNDYNLNTNNIDLPINDDIDNNRTHNINNNNTNDNDYNLNTNLPINDDIDNNHTHNINNNNSNNDNDNLNTNDIDLPINDVIDNNPLATPK
ncbi:7272_t:CDS:2 [Entrophospora sp. SA101]|nr:7272_t:CDS:2 [Entrophospora sp. SA101]